MTHDYNDPTFKFKLNNLLKFCNILSNGHIKKPSNYTKGKSVSDTVTFNSVLESHSLGSKF